MIVVKVGGGAGIAYDALCADLATLTRAGQRLVLVHGGSHETNTLAERLGHPPRFVTSPSGYTSRYTDRATLELFLMATAGKVNKVIVERLQHLGVNAIGLSGLDGRLLEGQRKAVIRIVEDGKQKVLRDDWTGTVEKVNTHLLTLLLNAGFLPVIAPIAASDAGEALNVDGDRAAAAIAAALGANTLILLTNVPGLLRAFPDESTLVRHIPRADIEEYLPLAQGRMKKKILGASEALAQGVGRVILGDARVAEPITRALAGEGTVIV
ncbi:[LysW]-aminoadipate kinase [Roseiflexus castenholzii]|jgi:acetylglutamate/LysW-gamma-L-alpha-aminoadipate kinase|uniref:Putative [LysW]-aminoadipate kinase n=1 Tax=Roseiflexus castenholzii (strain DSM 13941 / HLO8) TaxID=383372 RepID=A7NPM0_ROSCS|nr:[LysW]-aminoadipate kinase [Roseiflexus castenholzii]ABU59516.1 acetylglutamate kinase [Roseiflexus castenholzii DSM 13941]